MPGVANSPLNDNHLTQINSALAAVEVAKTQILLAKQAGIDVTNYEKQASDAETKLKALKQTYFPGSY